MDRIKSDTRVSHIATLAALVPCKISVFIGFRLWHIHCRTNGAAMNPKAFLAAQGYSSRSNQRAEAQRPTNIPRIGYISLRLSPARRARRAPLIKSLSSLFLPLFFTLFLTACSGYKEFYKQAQGETPEAVAAMRVATQSAPQEFCVLIRRSSQ